MRLLVGNANQVGELLLRQPEHDPPLADAGADMPVDILGAIGRAPRCGGSVRHIGVGLAPALDREVALALAQPAAAIAVLLFHVHPLFRWQHNASLSVAEKVRTRRFGRSIRPAQAWTRR